MCCCCYCCHNFCILIEVYYLFSILFDALSLSVSNKKSCHLIFFLSFFCVIVCLSVCLFVYFFICFLFVILLQSFYFYFFFIFSSLFTLFNSSPSVSPLSIFLSYRPDSPLFFSLHCFLSLSFSFLLSQLVYLFSFSLFLPSSSVLFLSLFSLSFFSLFFLSPSISSDHLSTASQTRLEKQLPSLYLSLSSRRETH
jgi:hypothetical protein